MNTFMMKKKNNVIETAVTELDNWSTFVKMVVAHVDPVLASMLYATEFKSFEAAQKVVRVATLKKFILFQDLFIEQKQHYQEYLDRVFGFGTVLVVEFVNAAVSEKPVLKPRTQVADQSVLAPAKVQSKASVSSSEFTDTKKWKLTHALLQCFGGNVREIVKDNHEFDA
jgi:hypothetical protein